VLYDTDISKRDPEPGASRPVAVEVGANTAAETNTRGNPARTRLGLLPPLGIPVAGKP